MPDQADAKKSIFIFGETETTPGAMQLLSDEAEVAGGEMTDEQEKAKQLAVVQQLAAEANGGAQDELLNYAPRVEQPGGVQKGLSPVDLRGRPNERPPILDAVSGPQDDAAANLLLRSLSPEDADAMRKALGMGPKPPPPSQPRPPAPVKPPEPTVSVAHAQAPVHKSEGPPPTPQGPAPTPRITGDDAGKPQPKNEDEYGKPIPEEKSIQKGELEKAHYTSRTGTPGSYQYTYAEPKGMSSPGEEHFQAAPTGTKVQVHHGPTSGGYKEEFVKEPEGHWEGEGGKAHKLSHTQMAGTAFGKPVLFHHPKTTTVKKSLTSKELSMSGIDALTDYLAKSQTLPVGQSSSMDQGHGENNPNGVDLATTKPPTPTEEGAKGGHEIGAPSVPEKKLSADDDAVAQQLKGGGEPGPKVEQVAMGKSLDKTGHSRRDVAAIEANLRKGADDVVVPTGPGAKPVPQELAKSRTWQQGLVRYSDEADLAVERMMSGDKFYEGSAPSLGLQKSALQDLAGVALAQPQAQGVEFQKSEAEAQKPTGHGPSLRPARRDEDITFTLKE